MKNGLKIYVLTAVGMLLVLENSTDAPEVLANSQGQTVQERTTQESTTAARALDQSTVNRSPVHHGTLQSVASTHKSRKSQTGRQFSQAQMQAIYQEAGRTYDISWQLLAAVDRYAQLTKTKQSRQEAPYYGLPIADKAWVGLDNPNLTDVNPLSIKLFHGMGMDANGDGLALVWDPKDRISALARWLDTTSGEEGVDVRLWDIFQDPIAMDRIFAFQRMFAEFGINPKGHCFPVSKRYNYTVKHTFGAGRSYGGRRIHEGVDIFAGYGTPVLACSYGYVELMGWNRFGGWRVGIRDANNVYYYYAHLSRYPKGLKRGMLVRPGQVIGYVGSTGYGPPGTAGKFPPHLHFGIYKHSGTGEWSYSPSGQLSQWERLPQKIIKPPYKGS